VDDLKQSPRFKLDPASVNDIGYELAGYRIELWGLCPQCREPSGAGPAKKRARKTS
jgi:Fe2+ or Zn2+ uptake regulation protein